MNQQYGLSQYINRSEENSFNNQSMISYSPHPLFYPKNPLFLKPCQEVQPQLDSCPFSREKMDECTQEKQINNQKPSEAGPNSTKKIYFSQLKTQEFKKSFKGSRNDTMELNINFKTLLVGYFRQLIYLNQLSPQEQLSVEIFTKQTPSFRALKAFYEQREGNEKIRLKCGEFLTSTGCLKRILRGRCKLRNKAMMIKFIEKMRRNLFNKSSINKWKDYSQEICPEE